jgi:hypothetical protein
MMLRRSLLLFIPLALPISLAAQCRTTASTVTQPFVPPSPYRATASPGGIWYGSSSLWTYIPREGFRTGDEDRLSAKLVYWRAGVDWFEEPRPTLTVVARRLDGLSPILRTRPAVAVKFPNDNTPSALAAMTGSLSLWLAAGK